jgi:hypothetical protein
MFGVGYRFLAVLLAAATICAGRASAHCPGMDPTWPGSGPDYYSVQKEFSRSSYVARVHVLAAKWLDEVGKPTKLKSPFLNGGDYPLGFDPYRGVRYRVSVLEPYKGAPPESLKLFSENASDRFILAVGKDYLLFMTRGAFDKPIGSAWTIDNCGNSEPWKAGSPTARQAEQLAAR